MKALLLIAFLSTIAATPADAQRFYPDDPLIEEPKPRRVGEMASRSLSDVYDLFRNTLATPGERQPLKGPSIRAQAVNTLGEPMEGAWWERRHYYRPMSHDELQRGPGGRTPPSPAGPWKVISAKTEGVTPGFVIEDSKGTVYFIKFDSRDYPELSSAADQISGKLFYALGYHVPDNYVVTFPASILEIASGARITDAKGLKRRMVADDLSAILQRAARVSNGDYRATASRALEGKPLGPYRYHGMRSDDVNDVVPHEHRRDLRGMNLAAAWVDHDDSRAVNTLDVLVEQGDLRFVKHFQLDFGSTLGSASYKPNSPRSGGEYLFSWRNAAIQFLSFGLVVPEWARARYPNIPSIGRFESARFRPERWVPEYPNPAFRNSLPDDDFWMAKQIMSLRDGDIRAIVDSAQFSDPGAAIYVAECLIRRRDKIGLYAFSRVLPLDNFEVRNANLRWDDVSSIYGLGGAGRLSIEWASFDNRTGAVIPIPGEFGSELPPAAQGGFLKATLTRLSNPSQKIHVYIRAEASSRRVVGVEHQW